MTKQELIEQLLSFDENELPHLFWDFKYLSATISDLVADKRKYIENQVNQLSDSDLPKIESTITRINTNRFSNAFSRGRSASDKPPKLFISHSSEDKLLIDIFVNLLERVGINSSDKLFYSSSESYGVDYDKYIYEELMEQFVKYNLFVVFLLSENFYKSPAALNEMGAAWVLRGYHEGSNGNGHDIIILPGFKFDDIKGCLEPKKGKISLNLGSNDTRMLNQHLWRFYQKLMSIFKLEDIGRDKWERYRDEFIAEIKVAYNRDK